MAAARTALTNEHAVPTDVIVLEAQHMQMLRVQVHLFILTPGQAAVLTSFYLFISTMPSVGVSVQLEVVSPRTFVCVVLRLL